MITNMFDFVRLPVTAPTGTYASFGVPMAPLFSHTSSGSTPGQFTVQHGYADHTPGNSAYAGDSIVIEGVPYTLQSVQLTYFTLTTTTMSLPSFRPMHPSHLVTGHYIVLSPVGGGPDVAYLGLDEDYTITGDITEIEVYSSPSTSRLALSEYDSNRSFVCFASGTMIMTEKGNVPVNALKCGDMVLTRDSGFRPIRWIGKRTVAATGAARPIVFSENSIGNRTELTLSQNHRVLVNSRLPNFGRLELIADTNECLVAAKHLVNGKNIVFREGA